MPYLIQEKNGTNFSHHLGGSKDGISMDITNATNAEMSNAQSETSETDLKENLLNVKVSRGFFFFYEISFKWFSGVLQHSEPKDDQRDQNVWPKSWKWGFPLEFSWGSSVPFPWSVFRHALWGGIHKLVSFAMLFAFKSYIRLQRSWPDMEKRRM